MTDLSVNISKTINAPIEQVFDAWLDPTLLAQFILPAPGMAQPRVENDARDGGRFSIIMQVGDEHIPHTGTYLVLERPHRLAFTWESPFSPDDSIVTLVFDAIDRNTTRVDLSHIRFINEEARANHEGGWNNILEQLAQVI
ncbi:MAG TPA: SRPBCC domain-containing protein [Gammaproteobacteria bacterium]|nr:SRPBCC domain-containing protein [Gammaproteobacteria bacterium]